ncbi:MAG: DNA-directed RNA polymerase subunit omega [Nitrospiraceae bacterium]|nr:MAG: DNA-directed RNA polymerase subunit omega [Nitrospiraceae bacterium]
MDIISLPIECENKNIDGNYRLVIAAVQRAKALSLGALPKITSRAKKITTLALEEVAAGVVHILTGAEAVTATEEAKKLVHKRMMDEAQQKETMPEDLTELEKDLKVYLSEKTESEQKRSIEDIFGE